MGISSGYYKRIIGQSIDDVLSSIPSDTADSFELEIRRRIRLVPFLCRKYGFIDVAYSLNIDPDDLSGIGLNSLYKAIQRYDESRGEFSTLLTRTLVNDMSSYLRKTSILLGLPTIWRKSLSKYIGAVIKGKSMKDAYVRVLVDDMCSFAQVRSVTSESELFDREDDNGELKTLDSVFSSAAGNGVADDDASNYIRREIIGLVGTLSPRKRFILMARDNVYATLNGNPTTLKEIGRILGVTPERVRQLRETALRDLRSKIERKKGLMELVA